jgi:phospholipid/cholesterol/gamma-HCH transport system substrate-binding protein
MEVRASYLLVGSVVLALLMALAVFTVWLVKADVDRDVERYEIAFEGAVTGLQEGSQVRYRGVPVGNVTGIQIDPHDVEQILVTIELKAATPVKTDTVATLEMQGITGVAFVQLRGGSNGAPSLIEDADGDGLPRIQSTPSAIEQVFESTPELLARAVAVVGRMDALLSEENIASVSSTLANVDALTGALGRRSDTVGDAVVDAAGAARQIQELSGRLLELSDEVDRQLGTVGDDVGTTLTDLQSAASSLGDAADELGGLVGELRQPLNDFAGAGMYEFSQLVSETRVLIAALNRITKEFERDPAGFLLGTQGGFQAE